MPRGFPRSSTAAAACSTRARRATGWPCWRRIERPASPVRARTASLTPFLGWRAERIAIARGGGVGGGPPAPSPLEPDPPRPRRRRAARGDHGRRGPGRSRARERRRRAPADRPAPPRPAAPPRRKRRAARDHRAARLARRACRRRRARRRRGGARAAARVRRRGRAGADDPPQQGPRVPRRVLPVPVGSDLDPAEGAGGVPRPRDRVPAHGRRRARRAGVQAPFRADRDRAARGGSPSRVRRAHPRQASGGDLVGRLHGTAVTRRSGGCCSPRTPTATSRPYGRSTPTDAAVVERFRELAAVAPGRIGVERSTLGDADRLEPADRAGGRARRRAVATAALDLSWRRTSYSDITAEAHDPLVASEPERPVLQRRARGAHAGA